MDKYFLIEFRNAEYELESRTTPTREEAEHLMSELKEEGCKHFTIEEIQEL